MSAAARKERATRRPVCVYIAGRGHSGSTLLEVLLGRHPEIASGGEVASLGLQCFRDERASWTGLCACGARPFDCAVWGQVIVRIRETYGIDMRTDPLAFRVSDVGLEEEYRARALYKAPHALLRHAFWRLLRHQQYSGPWPLSHLARGYEPQRAWALNRGFVLQCLAELQGVAAVVDSSKDPLGMRDMHDFAPLPVKILFLTRDCRGNVWSVAKHAKLPLARRAVVVRAARDWVNVNSRILRLLQGVSRSDWMHVRYEELCRSPEATLRSVFEFIGVAHDPSVLEDRTHLEHTIAGNKIRLSNTRAAIREDTAWQEHLDQRDLANIERIAAPLGRTFGYQFQ